MKKNELAFIGGCIILAGALNAEFPYRTIGFIISTMFFIVTLCKEKHGGE